MHANACVQCNATMCLLIQFEINVPQHLLYVIVHHADRVVSASDPEPWEVLFFHSADVNYSLKPGPEARHGSEENAV